MNLFEFAAKSFDNLVGVVVVFGILTWGVVNIVRAITGYGDFSKRPKVEFTEEGGD